MSERVIVRQNSNYETEFLASDPHDMENGEVYPVEHIHDLTPYGMLLVSIGSCTAILLNSYAQNHGLDLRSVELGLEFGRVFDQDCEDCEDVDPYEEQINKEVVLVGDLDAKERERLFSISQHCPIYKMVKHGTPIRSQLRSVTS